MPSLTDSTADPNAKIPALSLKQRIQIKLGDMTPKLLAECSSDVLEFEDHSGIECNKSSNTALKLLEMMKSKTPATKRCETSTGLQKWKLDIEKKMKVTRDLEMAKRKQLYMLDQEEVCDDVNEKIDEISEPEFDEEDSYVSETSENSDEEENSDTNEENRNAKNVYEVQIAKTNDKNQQSESQEAIICPTTSKSQDATEDLRLFLDTEDINDEASNSELQNYVNPTFEPDEIVVKPLDEDQLLRLRFQHENEMEKSQIDINHEAMEKLGMDADLTSQQAKDEVLLLLTNPFLASQNLSSKSIFTPSAEIVSNDFENRSIDNVSLDSTAKTDLKMDKFVTSEEAEQQVLGLLTNPFDNNLAPKNSNLTVDEKCDQEDTVDADDDEEHTVDEFEEEHSTKNVKRTRRISSDDEEEKDEKKNPKNFKMLIEDEDTNTNSDDLNDIEDPKINTDEDYDVENQDNNPKIESDDEEEQLDKQVPKNKFLDTNSRRLRKEFVENEAELSGSEIDSDDYEIGSEEDELEEEDGDMDILPSDSKLREQVGKIHNKQMLDDDQRRLKMYQEAYLPDGEMHDDTDAVRRFRWRKADDEIDLHVALNSSVNDEDVHNLDEEGMESWTEIQKEKSQFLLDKGLKAEEFEEKSLDADVDTLNMFKVNKIKIRRSTSFMPTSFAHIAWFEDQASMLASSEQNGQNTLRESFLNRQQIILSRIACSNDQNSNHNASTSTNSLFISEKSCSNDDFLARKKLGVEKHKKIENKPNFPVPDNKTVKQDSIFSLM